MFAKSIFIGILFLIVSFDVSAQYLPFTGGIMTGNITLNSGNQLQTPYLGFNASAMQPPNSSNVSIFPNYSSTALDIVGWVNGWRFIPVSDASYAAPVVIIDAHGNTSIQGNLSIGTHNNAGYKLAIAGSTIAESIIVKMQGSWPDYVFNPNYQLPPLSEIKKYIVQNGRLPEMPSADEVEKNGVNLGEVNKLLTKKLEEMTLYMIELKEVTLKQQSQIDTLIKKIAVLT